MAQLYRDQYEDDKAKTDRDLTTARIWDVWDGETDCPQEGDVVKFKRFTGIQLYHEMSIQFSTRVQDFEFYYCLPPPEPLCPRPTTPHSQGHQ